MVHQYNNAFFGCWGEAGHFMWAPGKVIIHHPELHGLPKDYELDGSHIFLPYPERVGEGRLTYLPAMNLSVLSWWNNVFDARGKVNSHLIVRNRYEIQTMWAIFEHSYKELAEKHTKPLVGITY